MKFLSKAFAFIAVSGLCIARLSAQGRAAITLPTVQHLAAHFKAPPPEYGPTVFWSWDGPVDSGVISRDMDTLQSLGFRMVTIQAGRGMRYPYLSSGYFKLVRYAVQAAKKRNMRVWFIDDGGYPSGFAGGLFSEKRRDLRMQALIPLKKIKVSAGQTMSQDIPSNTLSVVAYNGNDSSVIIPYPFHIGKIKWTAPRGSGNWTVLLVGYAFRTSPTRSVNNPTGAKDTTASLCDYLNPEATTQFIDWTHARYKKYIGDEFGKTVIGFRSDEPAYSYMPWTTDMLQEFREQKGYDVRPYLASFFIPHPTQTEKRAEADYLDVFSNLFRDNFFRIIADWCMKNNLEYEDHIDKDGPEYNFVMLALGRSEGDYFKDMRYMQVPGIDVIWHQLWPGEANNYPKLASSAAHLFGRPQVFSESFAAFNPRPHIKQVNWILDEQLVRGVNLFEIMLYSAALQKPRGFMASDSFPDAMDALSRKCYVLASGRPAEKIGVYFPSSSLWFGDDAANSSTWHIVQQLLNQQRDFDFVDEQSLSSLMKLKNGRFINLSGQKYTVIIIPSSLKVISQNDLQRLEAFAKEGGKVIFMGTPPALIKVKTFFYAKPLPDISWAIREPTSDISSGMMQLLPHPDVKFNVYSPAIQSIHRHLKDGELYFFFNESDRQQKRTVIIQGSGDVQDWNPEDGKIIPGSGKYNGHGYTKISLELGPYASRIIVLKAQK